MQSVAVQARHRLPSITDALHYIVWLIGQNNGSRGTTVGNVLASILRLASAFLSVGIVLYEIGIDGTALLTSAGIVSLVIGIAARGMFEDLIAGLFLIMDNKIHVGDRIDVGGFEGKVREIGVRLSVLENDDRRLVINNKDIKRFCQISDAESGKTSDDR